MALVRQGDAHLPGTQLVPRAVDLEDRPTLEHQEHFVAEVMGVRLSHCPGIQLEKSRSDLRGHEEVSDVLSVVVDGETHCTSTLHVRAAGRRKPLCADGRSEL